MRIITDEVLRPVWISAYYDGPLEGLCRLDGELMSFREWGEERGTYLVAPLTAVQKARWLLRKRLFELCVGTHWSYPQTERSYFHWRKPEWLHRILFWSYYKIQRILEVSA